MKVKTQFCMKYW